MRWVITLVFLAACGGSENDSRQEIYNALLQEARQNVSSDPEQSCNPAFQDLVLDQVAEESSVNDRALVKLAMGDACIEAGESAAEYSSYHEEAP